MAGEARAAGRASLDDLVREFGRRFWFSTARMRDHRALTALRRSRADEPGLYAVITPDPDEMRAALREDQASPPDAPDSG